MILYNNPDFLSFVLVPELFYLPLRVICHSMLLFKQFSFVVFIQEKTAPLDIRKAFYNAHRQMENISAKMESAAENLQKCFENLLHEDDLLQRAASMTSVQYNSLKEPFDGLLGRKDSAILHWLQLSWNSPSSNQGGNST